MRRSEFLAGCSLLIALFGSPPALSYNAASDISYEVTSKTLTGYFRTWKDPWDYDYYGECLYWGWNDLGWYDCLVYVESWNWVYVVGQISEPDGQLHASAGAAGWRDIQLDYSETVTTPLGMWTGTGYHYIAEVGVVWYCPYGTYYGYCYPAGGWQNWYNFANTADQVLVLPVEVEYTMLIPLDHVRMPWPWEDVFDGRFFDGDNTLTHVPDAEDYRIHQKFVIDTVNNIVTDRMDDSGTTRGYSPPEPHLSSEASCLRKYCPECPSYDDGRKIVFEGYCSTQEGADCAELASDMPSIRADVTNHSSTSVTATFGGDPNNACLLISWDISWANEITISWDGSSPQYQLIMDHDAFPLHELRINGSLVYQFDPISSGNTPEDLQWPRDIYTAQSGSLP